MTHLLDTDHISLLERRQGPDYAALVVHLNLHPDGSVGLPVAALHEQFLGAHSLITRARTVEELLRGFELLAALIEQFREFSLVPFDAAAQDVFTQLRSQKLRVSTPDLRIAATALCRNLTLVTRNRSDFDKVPGLPLADWTR